MALLADSSARAKSAYLHNFPTAPYVTADLSRVSARDISRWVDGRVDILLGCPPCQGFSDVGDRAGRDPRNRHVTIFGNFVAALKPLAIALENVPRFVTSPRYRRFCDLLDAEGYRWTAGILNAALYGSVQCRQRFILVAFRRDVGVDPRFPRPTHGGDRRYFSYRSGRLLPLSKDPIGLLGLTPSAQRLAARLPFGNPDWGSRPIPTVAEALAGLPTRERQAIALSHVPWGHSPTMLKRMGRIPEGGRWSGGEDHYSQSYGRLHRRGLARTITTFLANAGSGRFWHPVENRALTLREAARIQGFPDEFRFPAREGSSTLVGNALDRAFSDVVYGMIRRGLE